MTIVMVIMDYYEKVRLVTYCLRYLRIFMAIQGIFLDHDTG